MKAYFFNKKDELQKVIGEKNFIEAHLIEQINSASQLVFSLKKPLAISIQYVCIPSPNEDGFLMFKILTEEIKDSTIEYTCIEAAYNELASYGYVQDIRPNSRSARYMLEQVLQGTRWELGTIYDNSTNATTNFYYEPVLSCIQDIVDIFGLELTFTVGITGNQITARRVNLYRQQGNRTGKRFEYGSNALEVAQETSTDELYTALVGRGKGEQVDGDNNPDTLDGYGRRITFADIEWKKSAGKPLDKPKGQEYLEDPDATKLYGFSDGKPRIGIVTFEDDEDKDVLIQHTYEKLQEVKRPKVQFKASVIDVGDCTLGDTVAIIRHDFQIEYMTRIFKINHDLLDENNNTIELGDDLSGQDIVSKVNDVSSKLSDTQKQVSYVATTADGQHKVNYSATKPNTAKNGDLWYKDLGDGDTEFYIYNNGWQFVMSTKDTHDISDKVDQAMQEMADKEKEINGKLELNQIDVSQAQKDLEQVKQDTANQLADIRDSVVKDVADAKAQSKDALDKANGIDDKASQALENATEAKETATTVATDMDTVKGEISSKADKSTVDTINQTVSDQGTKITQNANDIKSKASSSDVDKLSGRVSTAETTLTQTANGLAGKADTTQLNKLSGDLTTLSNNFSTTSAGFNASLSKIDDKVNSNKEETDSALSVAKADIKATADNLSTNYTKTTDEHKYVNSQIKQSADKINLSVASVSDKVDGIQEWNKNYLTNTSDKEQTVTQSIWGDANELVHDIPQELFGTEITYSLHHISSTHSGYLYINIVDKDGNSSNKRVSGRMQYNADGFIEATFTIPADSQSAKTLGLKYDTAYAGNNLITYSSEKVEKGSKRTDWCPNDADTDSKIAALQIEDDHIKQTVSNKADTSYVDQKADQITSTVGNKADISYVDQQDKKIQSTVASKADASQITQLSNQINLKVSQTDFDNSIEHRNYLTDTYDGIEHISTTNSRGFMDELQRDITDFAKGKTLTYSMWHKSSTHTGYLCVQVDGTSFHSNTCQFNSYEWLSVTFSVPKDVKEVKILGFIYGEKFDGTNTLDYKREKLEIGKVATDWSPSPEDAATKDGLVSQINIDKSGVLIQGKKIMIDGDATIKNAVIKSSMIDTLDASKITAGTLNAANVNIINLNANNITTGTLRGTNLSMNLNTGEVLFQKGSIKSTNGNLNLDIDNGKMAVVNSSGNGFRFEDGKLYLASNTWMDSFQSEPDYGYIAYEPNFLSNVEGMQIVGTEGIAMSAGGYDSTQFIWSDPRPVSGAALSLRKNGALLNARDQVRIQGGTRYAEDFFMARPTIVLGGKNGPDSPTDNYGNYHLQEPSIDAIGPDIFMKGVHITLQGGHDSQYTDLNLLNDGKPAISSTAIHNRTYSNSPNMYITGYGTLGRSTSASKYKLDISDVDNLTEKAQVFLAVKPKQWFDKQETQDFADKLMGNDRSQESPTVNPHAGFIAEDLAVAGLNEFISYGADGSLEGIQYDRLPILHHELLRQAYNKIDYLMTQLNIMDKKISKLEGAN